ncbi:MAG TPA: protein-L-isoaspartate(D-aspartate) O-methyltransferase [Thermoanaerobaculia bacterium]|nr:protein-L-isoaspartate(D-aspartate) O-methyltransferase [Thermoanaerobaculia bacterium]
MTRTRFEPMSPAARPAPPLVAPGRITGRLLRGVFLAAAVALSVGTFALFAGRPTNDPYQPQRRAMVEQQIVRRGVVQKAVLEAMREVPRHEFVPSSWRSWSYTDRPLPIGFDQTISQPYIVARMTELLRLDRSSKVLEIGTGSGYHAAVLSRVAGKVYSMEILQPLADRARRTLEGLGFDNVQVRVADGYRGWPEEAPFDAIVLTAAPAEIPQPLLDQLKVGGRMVLPQGTGDIQELLLVTKTAESFERERIAAVRFVPMTGEARKER